MLSKTVTYNGATITLNRASVRSRLRSGVLFAKLGVKDGIPDEEWYCISTYARFLTQATIEGNIGFYIPEVGASEADMQRGLDAFLSADESFYDAVVSGLNEIDDLASEDAVKPDTGEKKEH